MKPFRTLLLALLVALADRETLGVGAPTAAKVAELAELTGGTVVPSIALLPSVVANLAGRRRQPT